MEANAMSRTIRSGAGFSGASIALWVVLTIRSNGCSALYMFGARLLVRARIGLQINVSG